MFFRKITCCKGPIWVNRPLGKLTYVKHFDCVVIPNHWYTQFPGSKKGPETHLAPPKGQRSWFGVVKRYTPDAFPRKHEMFERLTPRDTTKIEQKRW